MNKTENRPAQRVADPFDGTARARLEHMGLYDYSGQMRTNTMLVFANIFTGQFFDDLNECHGSAANMLSIYEAFRALYEKEDYQHMYLMMSVQYDYISKPLPDPVWWIAGDPDAVTAFMAHFIRRYEHLMEIEGFLVSGEGAEQK